jgi:plastocyanin
VQMLSQLAHTGLIAAICVAPLLSPAVASAAQTLTVSAGAESSGGDVQLTEFAPVQVTVNVGDTVTWSLDSTEFHDVLFTAGAQPPDFIQPGPDGVFINPLAGLPQGGPSYDGTVVTGSGLLIKGQSWSLTFTKAGTYPYYCVIHAGMIGSIEVEPSGQSADTQTSINARRTAQINADIATKGVPIIMANQGELSTDAAAAGIVAGAQNGPTDVQRFFPPRVAIHAGDSLSWVWRTEETPHTVTFLVGQPAPEVVVPLPQTGGPPRLQLNPLVLVPGGDPTAWDGSSWLNSGFIQPTSGQPTPTFTVRFTTPGSYDYVCVLHDGMVGTIVVVP